MLQGFLDYWCNLVQKKFPDIEGYTNNSNPDNQSTSVNVSIQFAQSIFHYDEIFYKSRYRKDYSRVVEVPIIENSSLYLYTSSIIGSKSFNTL